MVRYSCCTFRDVAPLFNAGSATWRTGNEPLIVGEKAMDRFVVFPVQVPV